MLKSRIAWLACGLFTTGVGLAAAADFSTYRGFRFGAKIEAMVKLAGAKPTDVRVMHTRPALIQEFTWRPIYVSPSTTKRPDPVQDGVLRFFNGDLFQMVITVIMVNLEQVIHVDVPQVGVPALSFPLFCCDAVEQVAHAYMQRAQQRQ